MNADLLKIRNSKLFKKLPERGFEKLVPHLKVRVFLQGEAGIRLKTNNEFEDYFGYVVTGQILLLDEADHIRGLALKDEFFLGRPFSLGETRVMSLVSASEASLVVFIPKVMIEGLAKASAYFSESIAEIYQSVVERSDEILSDPITLPAWKNPGAIETFENWLVSLEGKRKQNRIRKRSSLKLRRFRKILWSFSGVLAFLSLQVHSKKIFGFISVLLLVLVMLQSVFLWIFRKKNPEKSFEYASILHEVLGMFVVFFALLHSGFRFFGGSFADLAMYVLIALVLEGWVLKLRLSSRATGARLVAHLNSKEPWLRKPLQTFQTTPLLWVHRSLGILVVILISVHIYFFW